MKAWLAVGLCLSICVGKAADYALEDAALSAYFEGRTAELEKRWAGKFSSLQEWEKVRPRLKAELMGMLGLDPLPARTELQTKVTGRVERPDYTVENLHFQSMPGLYVTGNFYLPNKREGKVPAILYVCGHSFMMTNGISLGNKTGYEHHGAWFARNGYACLVIDTVQLGEIPGIHHGTYREGMWWWNARGYTPAGVEAWNSMRAIDYLQTRREVDGERIGMTGRSGGGAYTWYTAAIDERVKVAAPIAGITDMRNHVVDGVVEGHCDCMYNVNTRQWDFWLLAALMAPRPLLIGNTDKDTIFPLDGVVRVHAEAARIYKHYGKANQLGLLITEGPHKDTQDLQLPVFRWFNRFLKSSDPVIAMAATPEHPPMELKVFAALPSDSINGKVHESFVPISRAPVNSPDDLRDFLQRDVFAAWPKELSPKVTWDGKREQGKLLIKVEPGLQVRGGFLPAKEPNKQIVVRVEEKESAEAAPGVLSVAVRLAGENVPDPSKRNEVQIRRRYMLLGTTVDAMRVWDIRAAVKAAHEIGGLFQPQVVLSADGPQAVNALYAALFEPSVRELRLSNLPSSHKSGPDYLNVLKRTDIPRTLALVSREKKVVVKGAEAELKAQAMQLGRKENLVFE